MRTHKIGFMVDSAIYGFAVGAGFAFVENIYYLQSLENANLFLWIIRGFGTAVMHGGTTAVFAILSKTLTDGKSSSAFYLFFAWAFNCHYNSLIFQSLLFITANDNAHPANNFTIINLYNLSSQ